MPATNIGDDGVLHIVDHFKASHRKVFESKDWTVAAGNVWMDQFNKWW